MIIECPSCGTRAKLPDSKAGAKVRCSDCERVYLAKAAGSRAPVRSRSSALPIGIGAGVVALVLLLFALNQRSEPPAPPVSEPEEVVTKAAPLTGWDSPLVKFAREMHTIAASHDESRLQMLLATDRVWARLESEEQDEVVDPAGFLGVDSAVRMTLLDDVLGELMSDDPDNLVGEWTAFDGQLLEEGDQDAVVRLTVAPNDTTTSGTRHLDWKLIKTAAGWKAWSWERWLSPEELAAGRIAKTRSRKKKTLSDGSIVYEAEPEKVEYMAETSPEARAQIESLIAQMVNLDSRPRPRTEAQNELRAIGKPAVPGLLNKMYDLDQEGWPDHDAVSRGQLVHMMLQDITGYVTTFNPHEALGGTDERRDSGVRQWFFWFSKKFDRFEAAPEEVDLLEAGWEPKTETEKREYEKYKRAQEADEKP